MGRDGLHLSEADERMRAITAAVSGHADSDTVPKELVTQCVELLGQMLRKIKGDTTLLAQEKLLGATRTKRQITHLQEQLKTAKENEQRAILEKHELEKKLFNCEDDTIRSIKIRILKDMQGLSLQPQLEELRRKNGGIPDMSTVCCSCFMQFSYNRSTIETVKEDKLRHRCELLAEMNNLLKAETEVLHAFLDQQGRTVQQLDLAPASSESLEAQQQGASQPSTSTAPSPSLKKTLVGENPRLQQLRRGVSGRLAVFKLSLEKLRKAVINLVADSNRNTLRVPLVLEQWLVDCCGGVSFGSSGVISVAVTNFVAGSISLLEAAPHAKEYLPDVTFDDYQDGLENESNPLFSSLQRIGRCWAVLMRKFDDITAGALRLDVNGATSADLRRLVKEVQRIIQFDFMSGEGTDASEDLSLPPCFTSGAVLCPEVKRSRSVPQLFDSKADENDDEDEDENNTDVSGTSKPKNPGHFVADIVFGITQQGEKDVEEAVANLSEKLGVPQTATEVIDKSFSPVTGKTEVTVRLHGAMKQLCKAAATLRAMKDTDIPNVASSIDCTGVYSLPSPEQTDVETPHKEPDADATRANFREKMKAYQRTPVQLVSLKETRERRIVAAEACLTAVLVVAGAASTTHVRRSAKTSRMYHKMTQTVVIKSEPKPHHTPAVQQLQHECDQARRLTERASSPFVAPRFGEEESVPPPPRPAKSKAAKRKAPAAAQSHASSQTFLVFGSAPSPTTPHSPPMPLFPGYAPEECAAPALEKIEPQDHGQDAVQGATPHKTRFEEYLETRKLTTKVADVQQTGEEPELGAAEKLSMTETCGIYQGAGCALGEHGCPAQHASTHSVAAVQVTEDWQWRDSWNAAVADVRSRAGSGAPKYVIDTPVQPIDVHHDLMAQARHFFVGGRVRILDAGSVKSIIDNSFFLHWDAIYERMCGMVGTVTSVVGLKSHGLLRVRTVRGISSLPSTAVALLSEEEFRSDGIGHLVSEIEFLKSDLNSKQLALDISLGKLCPRREELTPSEDAATSSFFLSGTPYLAPTMLTETSVQTDPLLSCDVDLSAISQLLSRQPRPPDTAKYKCAVDRHFDDVGEEKVALRRPKATSARLGARSSGCCLPLLPHLFPQHDKCSEMATLHLDPNDPRLPPIPKTRTTS
ncbi:hypothetical protein DIPPA_02961 [Diplonema papillatum]|nr:hypothetical protein DIPPA_02961 [Diplonema papillatum]